jgi:hypothetical protein
MNLDVPGSRKAIYLISCWMPNPAPRITAQSFRGSKNLVLRHTPTYIGLTCGAGIIGTRMCFVLTVCYSQSYVWRSYNRTFAFSQI